MRLTTSQADDVRSCHPVYAFEAVARTGQLAGSHDDMKRYLRQARRTVDAVADIQARSWLLADLDTTSAPHCAHPSAPGLMGSVITSPPEAWSPGPRRPGSGYGVPHPGRTNDDVLLVPLCSVAAGTV